MKTTRILPLIVSAFGLVLTPFLLSSCAADPTLQKQMDQDISSAAKSKKAGHTPDNQQGQGSQQDQGGF